MSMTKKKKLLAKYTPGKFKLRVRRALTGKGLFADEDIPKGVCILEYTGKLLPKDVAEEDDGKYYFHIGKGRTINGNIKSNLARYINHSCVGNCEAIGPTGRVFIFSCKRIKAGDELTYDYGKEYFDRHITAKRCQCPKHQKLRHKNK